MSQIMVIYHGGCTDGWCAAWVLDKCLGGVELHPARHGDEPPCVSGRTVFIVDFAYSFDELVDMEHDSQRIVVLDHHKTAQKELSELDFVQFDMNRSGAMMAYDWCLSNKVMGNLSNASRSGRDIQNGMRVLCDYVQDDDLGNHRLPSSRQINACIRSYQFDKRQWDMLARRSVVALESMIQEGEAIMRYRRDLIEQHKKRVEDGRVQIGGHDVKIVECTCREIVGDLLNEMAVGEPFVASYYMQAERMVFSLRSEEGAVDVSEVAEVYGGGGHVNSAGFTIPRAGLKVI